MTDLQQIVIDNENRPVTPIHIDTLRKDSRLYENVLLDISKDKKWISYITKTYDPVDENKQKSYLTVRNFTEIQVSFDTITFLSIDITDLVQYDDSLKFLSISPNGKSIALSYYTYLPSQQKMDNCFIFEVTNNSIALRGPPIKHQGRAVFTDNNLVIMNDTCVVILDKEYKDLCTLQFPKPSVPSFYDSPNQFLVSWVSSTDIFNSYGQSPIVHNTLFLQHKYVILFNNNSFSLWSIENKCNIVTVPENETFVAMLDDQRCITYNRNWKNFKLIDIVSGATVSMFKSQIKYESQPLPPSLDFTEYWFSEIRHFVSDARIINKGRHLVMAGISREFLGETLHIWCEVWNIESGLSIDWICRPHKNSELYNPLVCHHTIWPLILENSVARQVDSSTSEKGEGSNQVSHTCTTSQNAVHLPGSSSTNEEDGPEYWRNQSLKTPLAKSQAAKRTKGNLTLLYSNYQEIVSEEWDIFVDTSKHSIHDSTGILGNSCRQEYPGWNKDKHPIFRDHSFSKTIESRYYRAYWGFKTLRLWCFDHESTLAQNLGPEYIHCIIDDIPYEEKIAESGQLMCSYTFEDMMHGDTSCFIENMGRYDRLLVKIHSKSDNCSFFEECILPLNINDNGVSNYYGYNFKNACKTIYDSPRKTQLTKPLLFDMLTKIKSHPSSYFTTSVGCHTLDLLASFEQLHDVLYHLLKNDQLPIMVHSFEEESTQRHEDINNVLIHLIHQKKNDLFNLMLNRILLSRSYGANCFSVLTETLIYLQNQGQRELLLETCKKLSFLDIDKTFLPTTRLGYYMENPSTNIRSLDTFSTPEQLQSRTTLRKKSTVFSRFANGRYFSYFSILKHSTFIKNYSNAFFTRIMQKLLVAYLKDDYQKYKQPIQAKYLKICIVPLIHFNSYYVHPIDKQLTKESIETGKPFNESLFIQIATKIDDNNIFNEGDLVFEIMLEHKWKHFAQWRFFVVCLIHIMFYVSYIVGISFATKVFDYVPGSQITHGGQIICLCLMFIAELILLIQEVRQAFKAYSKIYYLRSPYNWIDWASLILPLIMLVFLRQNNSAFNELNSFTALVLWLHGIIRVRVFRTIGVTLETIIQLVLEVKGILLVFFLIVCAFTNAFIVLLMDKEDEYFQEQFSGNMIPSEASNVGIYDATFSDISASNPFKDVFKSFSTLWFFIFGVWDPLTDGDAGDNRVIIVLGILFSLLTILIFFNLVIVYMSGKIEEIRKMGKKAWTRHYASVVAEIEQLWCHPREKIDRNMHPSYIYYYAHINDVDRQARAIEGDTEEIIKRLDKVYGADIPRKYNEKDRPLQKEDVIEILRGFFDRDDDHFTQIRNRLRSRNRNANPVNKGTVKDTSLEESIIEIVQSALGKYNRPRKRGRKTKVHMRRQ